jgi:hypothetical protein
MAATDPFAKHHVSANSPARSAAAVTTLNIQAKIIKSTGTTATSLVALS